MMDKAIIYGTVAILLWSVIANMAILGIRVLAFYSARKREALDEWHQRNNVLMRYYETLMSHEEPFVPPNDIYTPAQFDGEGKIIRGGPIR